MLPENLLANQKFYIICTTARSGSNLLCDLLSASQLMGKPQEYLNIKRVVRYSEQYNLMDSKSRICWSNYFDYVIRNFSSKNQVFGMKFLYDQFEPLAQFNTIKQVLQRCKFIWLVRQDIIAQAISMYIARETNIWHSDEEDKSKKKIVQYDENKISYFVDYLAELNWKWQQFFSINNVSYLTVNYEDLLVDTDRICQKICNYVGVKTDSKFTLKTANSKKQGDNLNEEFYRIFCNNNKMNIHHKSNENLLKIWGLEMVDSL